LYDLGWSMHFVGKDFQDDYSTVLSMLTIWFE
jgi:hypothetical protein